MSIPTNTMASPINWSNESRSSKKIEAKTMVEIGPTLPMIGKLEKPNFYKIYDV